MNSFLRMLCPIAFLIATSCATQVGKARFPEASADFTPKRTYEVQYDKVWDAVIAALDKNRVAATSTDKASGLIQTDYLQGGGYLLVGGLGGTQSTRYKFNITLRKQTNDSVKLNILASIESSIHNNQGGSSPWSDVTKDNTVGATKLENWLYQEVEKGL